MRLILLAFFCFSSLPFFAQSFQQIESVEYDPVNGQWLVSNGSSIIADNGQGDLSYFGSASATHGMEVLNGVLYAIGNNIIRAYDLSDASLLSTTSISGASFLNGMTNDGSNRLWVSDFSNGNIIELDVTDPADPQYSVVANSGGSPNGIVYDEENNRCVLVRWGNNAAIQAMDLDTYDISTIINSGLGNLDGIDRNSEGDYFVSSWSPNRITRYSSDFSVSETVTSMGLSSPADICYALENDTLAVPNSGNETVSYISFVETSVDEIITENELNIWPNPGTGPVQLGFYLSAAEQVSVTVYDLNGKVIMNESNVFFPQGKNRLILNEEFSAGQYLIELIAGNQRLSSRFFIH